MQRKKTLQPKGQDNARRGAAAFNVYAPHSSGTLIPWDEVRLFLALCRSRTLGEAGRRVGVDASTMSRRLGALEKALDTSLFERGRDGIIATEAAEKLLPVAEEMEYAMARFAGAADAFERDVSGPVRLACPGGAAELLLAPRLPRLLTRHPRLQLNLVAGESIVNLARRDADLALRTVRPNAGDLIVTRLFSITWRAVVAPRLARARKPLRTLAEVPWIGCSSSMRDTTPGRWLETTLGRIEPIMRADRLTEQLACVRAGVGAALIPDSSIETSGLVPLKLSKRLQAQAPAWPRDDLFLVTHRALRQVPRVRAVWDFLLQELGAGQ